MTLAVIALLVLLAISGTPLYIVIAAASLYGFYVADIDLQAIAIEIYRIAETPLLIALPLFTLAGYILSASQISHRIMNMMQAIAGWMPGGVIVIAFIVSAMFTAFTGASGVTIVALGALLFPALVKMRYKEDFCLGMVTTSGSLGLLIVPSLPLILYGIIAQQLELEQTFTLNDLFLAGILPSVLMIMALVTYSIYLHRDIDVVRTRFNVAKLREAIWSLRWELPMPLLLVAGIYSGYFVISEAAALIAIYVIVVEVFILKEISLKKLVDVSRDAMLMVSSIVIILAVSMALTNVFVDIELADSLFDILSQYISNKYIFLILLNIFLLFVGAMIDIYAALVIIVPMVLPIAMKFGIHPVHLGIIFLANMQIGYMTPPVGINLFISSSRFKQSIENVYKSSLPFLLVLLFCLMLITFVPEISMLFIDDFN